MKDTFLRYSIVLGCALVLMLVAAVLGGIIGYGKGQRSADADTVVRNDTVTIRDTVTVEPSAAAFMDSMTGTDAKPVPITVHDTCWIRDTCWVYLAIGHHHAHVDDIGDIWYSGYDAKIDSMRFFTKRQLVTEMVEVPVSAPLRSNTISVVAGFNDASLMYTRRLGRIVVGASAGYDYDKRATARAVIGFSF